MMAPLSPSPAHRPELAAFPCRTPRTEAWRTASLEALHLGVLWETRTCEGWSHSCSSPRWARHSPAAPLPIPAEGVGPRRSRHARLTVQLVLREAGPAQVPHGEQGYREGRRREGPEGDNRQWRLAHTPLHEDLSERGRTERGEGFLRLS